MAMADCCGMSEGEGMKCGGLQLRWNKLAYFTISSHIIGSEAKSSSKKLLSQCSFQFGTVRFGMIWGDESASPAGVGFCCAKNHFCKKRYFSSSFFLLFSESRVISLDGSVSGSHSLIFFLTICHNHCDFNIS